MEGKHLRTLASEIFKTINNINPKFKKNIFNSKNNAKIRPFDIIAWLKNTESITNRNKKNKPVSSVLRNISKTWFGPGCKCNACQTII